MKLFLLVPRTTSGDARELFDPDDKEVFKLYIIRAPSEAIAREMPHKDDTWAFNGGKSPWQDRELTLCNEICDLEIPVNPGNGQKYSPEEWTCILFTTK